MARARAVVSGVLVCVAVIACKRSGSGSETSATPPPARMASDGANDSITPSPFPDPKIPEFHFPEPQATIDGWSANNDQVAMAKHAWGIWTALTADSGQVFHGETLRVFETWSGPDDLRSGRSGLARSPRDPRPLEELRQFRKLRTLRALTNAGDQTVMGFVKYDPTAAAFISSNELLSKTKLGSFTAAGAIPDLPATAIALKPVFQPLPASTAVGGRYAQLASWPGPPSKPKPFGSGQWKQCVWIDLREKGDGTGSGFDTKCAADGSSRTPASTFGLGRFISFQMSADDVDERNAFVRTLEPALATRAGVSKPGDHAVLLAMHVTTREITRWTWATFWWTPTPDAPPAPSSKEIAAQRPAQLTGPARSYAHCVANMMESPSQPETGGKNAGESVYCYNPWLEAGFGPEILPDSEPGTSHGKKVDNNVGVQTNCMSCHARAYFDPAGGPDPQDHYCGDRYVDIKDPLFTGKVRVDFLWSISNMAR